MKKSAWIVLLLFFGNAAFALDASFTGYLRGGTGVNFQGGKQECFYNQGIPNNFLRLGNECDFYTELGMVFYHLKPTEKDPMYFKTQLRLMYSSLGTRQWEAAANRDMSQIEAFVEAGGFAEVPGDFWVGKRFYREVDLHIFDWYYYAEMSGVGAGIENIPLGVGKFSIAHLIQANDDIDKTDTSVGRPVLQAIDLRWKFVPIGDQLLHTWGVFAFAPDSSHGVDHYQATNGYSLAERLEGKVLDGDNNFSLMYGKGAMKDFNIYGSSAVPANDDSQNRAWNTRLVEDWHRDVTDKWGFMLGLAANYGDNGKPGSSIVSWEEIGIRPIYFVSDRFQWVFETGYSHIKDDGEVDANNKPVGDRELVRVTIAPQLSISKSIWGRPVLRAFLTHSIWNSANKADIGIKAPSFQDKTEGTSFGYQFEAWF